MNTKPSLHAPTSRLCHPAALCLAVLFLTGCYNKDRETRSVLYLDPDGRAVWSILEWNIDPGRGEPENERRSAEKDFLAAARGNAYPVKRALDMAGALEASSTLLKDEAPFEIYSMARFRGIETLFRDLYLAGGALCESQIESEGTRRRWTLRVLDESGDAMPGVEALLDSLGSMRIVLTRGQLIEARGFKILDDHTAESAQEDKRDGEPETLVLVWDTEEKEKKPGDAPGRRG